MLEVEVLRRGRQATLTRRRCARYPKLQDSVCTLSQRFSTPVLSTDGLRTRTFADLVSTGQYAAVVLQKHCDTPRSSTIEQHRNIRGYARSPHRGQVPSSASCSSFSQAISSAFARSRKRFLSYEHAQPPRFSCSYWRRKRFGWPLTAFTHLAPISFVARASSLSPSEPRSAVGSAKSSVSCYVAGIPRISERASE